jgi:hypothetical protein
MDPLTPTTSTLTPAIGHIAETAATLSNELKKSHAVSAPDSEAQRKQRDQKAAVRWVLDAPSRLRMLLESDRREEAEKQWKDVSRLLSRWDGTKGVSEVREACMVTMGSPGAT